MFHFFKQCPAAEILFERVASGRQYRATFVKISSFHREILVVDVDSNVQRFLPQIRERDGRRKRQQRRARNKKETKKENIQNKRREPTEEEEEEEETKVDEEKTPRRHPPTTPPLKKKQTKNKWSEETR